MNARVINEYGSTGGMSKMERYSKILIWNQLLLPDVSPDISCFSGTSGKIHKYRCIVSEPSPVTKN
jgi:hypothetical protein